MYQYKVLYMQYANLDLRNSCPTPSATPLSLFEAKATTSSTACNSSPSQVNVCSARLENKHSGMDWIGMTAIARREISFLEDNNFLYCRSHLMSLRQSIFGTTGRTIRCSERLERVASLFNLCLTVDTVYLYTDVTVYTGRKYEGLLRWHVAIPGTNRRWLMTCATLR